MEYVDLLKALLVEENGKTPSEANRLIREHPAVISKGIMLGGSSLRAVVMRLEMEEDGRTNGSTSSFGFENG